MGYSTDFDGSFSITPALDEQMTKYLFDFAYTRHVRRDVDLIRQVYPNYKSHCLDGELGFEGEFFVGGHDERRAFAGGEDPSVIDYNHPPETQPGLYCQWVPSEDGTKLQWDMGEKFYNYEAWLRYLLDNIFIPYGYTLNGEIFWYGEDSEDIGKLVIEDNYLRVLHGEIQYVYREAEQE